MFPYMAENMAEGHLIPFLALARLIEKKNVYIVIIVNTPLNIKKLRSSLATDSENTNLLSLSEIFILYL